MTETGGHSLQRRLLVTMAAGFAILVLLISVLLWTYARAAANRSHDLLLAGTALSILERVSVGPEGATVDLPSSAMEILSLNPVDRVQYSVSLPDGQDLTGEPDLPAPSGLTPSATPVFFEEEYLGADFRFVIQSRQLSASEGRQWVVVQVGQSVELRNAQQRSFFVTGLIGLAGLSLIGLGFVWVAIRTSLAPLRQIAADLAQREPADLGTVVGTPPREIRGLFDAINGFIERLSRSRALTETFIADVAHQTRTSLSALQGHLSLAVDADNTEQMRSRLAKADRQAMRTVRLTNQLLANAMVIHRSDRSSLQPVALRPLVRDMLAETLRDSRMRRISLSLIDDGIREGEDMILGDPVSIREALRNLIENAVRHGPPDNTVTISLVASHAVLILSVEDAGPGIAEADLPRATERFTSLSESSTGSGLGLSIVKAVTDGHGADLRLGRSSLGGLGVTLIFKRLMTLLVLLAWPLWASAPAQAETLLVHSATDTPAMTPLIEAFEARMPGVQVEYVEFQTLDLYRTVLMAADSSSPDLVISSAMDLQVDLVNRGFARRIQLSSQIAPPSWSVWRSEVFGFTFEPAVIIYNKETVSRDELPRSHRDLATFVRENEDRFRGRIGTYDIAQSGIGYLYATQDSLQGPQVLRLFEILGRADLRTYCCTSEMVEATARGELAFAFNAIGSYAAAELQTEPNLGLHFFDDYNLAMTRTAFVPNGAHRADLAARFIEFLLSGDGQRIIAEETPLIPLIPDQNQKSPIGREIQERLGTFLPIRLTPGLLTYLDELKRKDFLSAWETALGR
ncbi:Swarming motility regulation sensor protein RssA (plasmid) [Sulfitobacter sp. THAF37]|uniref:sensor histidine kinase n=1 Tax=Sulfitobacter sp. THAF37 TaxID=2587855 RepID=UPI0012AA44FE|nr:extracellular solute-binding protein [Sulfitobacter sp. THAF37]QFT60853.1 Swarming motility regulation sensor protein RssA [Sulfitobacter sp. THAF37]